MGRRGANYSTIGKKIAALAKNQAELAQVLDLTQQSVSGKLNGKIAVSLRDLDLLVEHYSVPVIYFLSPDNMAADLARAWVKILEGSPETSRVAEIASTFPEPFGRQLLKIVKAMRDTSEEPTDLEGPQDTVGPPKEPHDR